MNGQERSGSQVTLNLKHHWTWQYSRLYMHYCTMLTSTGQWDRDGYNICVLWIVTFFTWIKFLVVSADNWFNQLLIDTKAALHDRWSNQLPTESGGRRSLGIMERVSESLRRWEGEEKGRKRERERERGPTHAYWLYSLKNSSYEIKYARIIIQSCTLVRTYTAKYNEYT